MIYAIQAQMLTEQDGMSGSRQIPTFYLDSSVQGITGPEHAKTVAEQILNPFGEYSFSITVNCLEEPFDGESALWRAMEAGAGHNANNPAYRAGWRAAINKIAEG